MGQPMHSSHFSRLPVMKSLAIHVQSWCRSTPPHDVIDIVSRTIVTTMGAYKNEATNSEKEPSLSEPTVKDTKATVKRPLLLQPSSEAKKMKGD
nr:hypothetical protein [Tanacetum cinerariifolium]